MPQTIKVGAVRVASCGRYLEEPIALGWSRWRACEAHYTRRNVDLLLQGLVRAGALPDDTPIEAMAQLLTGMITHAGIALAEAPLRESADARVTHYDVRYTKSCGA